MCVGAGGALKIRQKVYFAASSRERHPDQMSGIIGLEPDRTIWRGSRSREPPRPVTNRWIIDSHGDGTVDERIEELLGAIEPVESGLRRLKAESDAVIDIQVVRYFDDPDGTEDDHRVVELPGMTVERLEGQHQLLSFHLDSALLQRLAALSCSVDFDEYA